MEATSRGEYTEQTKKATDLKDDVITISDDDENEDAYCLICQVQK